MTTHTTAVPASYEATVLGCTCPADLNRAGKGVIDDSEKRLYWIAATCPLHGYSTEWMDEDTNRKKG